MKFMDVELRPSRTFFKDMDSLVGEFGGDSLIVNLCRGVMRGKLSKYEMGTHEHDENSVRGER